MDENQSKPFYKKASFILSFILAVFFLKGLVLVALIPMFQAPDELTHYFRTQYNSRQEKNKPVPEIVLADGTATQYSEELANTEALVQSQAIAGKAKTQSVDSQSIYGNGEREIMKNQWKHYTNIYPRRAPDYPTLYYKMTAAIEDILSSSNIFIRFYFIRIFSILLGMLIVFLAYLTSRNVGFSKIDALLATAIISFQPMLSATAAVINPDILLILCFTLFLYSGTALLRKGFNYPDVFWLLVAVATGIFTKGPGIALTFLAYLLLAYLLYVKKFVGKPVRFLALFWATSLFLVGLAYLIIPHSALVQITQFGQSSMFSTPAQSLSKYFNKSFNPSHIKFSNLTYWGNFGSLDASVPYDFIKIIRVIEEAAAVGILLFLVPWFFKKRDFLPEKKHIVFFMLSLIVLQVAIRFYDWRIFDLREKILISTPGRYFLPNVAAHMLLLTVGLGWFCRKKEYFTALLKILLVLMAGFFIHAVFNVIIPRYYI